jgi:hypothetical protein
MTRSFLSAWVLFPAVLLVLSAGAGLLVRRVAGGRLPAVLALPVGFSLLVAVSAFITSFQGLAPYAGLAMVLLAVAGVVAGARDGTFDSSAAGRRLRSLVWPALAALVVFAAVGGPVFLGGVASWTGYTRIVDIGFQMDLAHHLAVAGRHSPPVDSSYDVAVQKLTTIGYPGGGQALLGSTADLVGADVVWCYQAYLAFAAAMGAMAIFSLLGGVCRRRPIRALGAAVAIQPNLLYGYTLEGGIKEITTAVLLMIVAAVFAEDLPGDGPVRSVVPAAVGISAAFAAFSVGVAPWLGLLLAGLFIVTMFRGGRRVYTLASWGALAAAAIVLSLPSLISALKLATIAGAAVGGVVNLGLGNLAAPVPDWSSTGVWLSGDYRYPLVHVSASHAAGVLVIVLAVVGIVFALARRRWSLGVLGLSAPVALYYWIEHTGPWIEFKAFTVTGVLALTLAFAAVAALSDLDRRWAAWIGWMGWGLALAVTAVVLYGNALIYHDTTVAPAARYQDLAEIGQRYAGQGPALYPAFDEYAEYFLRDERASDLVNPAYGRFALAKGVTTPPGGVSFSWDLNQIELSFLETFPLIVMPRSPIASRTPSNYDLAERTKYFEVWRRVRPADTVLAHFPLSDLPHERTPALCRVVTAAARRAGPGAQVAYANRPAASVANVVQGSHPDYWKVLGPGTLAAYGAGTAQTTVTLPHSGHYDVWLQGSVGRPLSFYLDGRRIAGVSYEERYPNQFLLVGGGTFPAGTHTLRVVRGGGSLHPGSGDAEQETGGRTIGAIVFSPEDPSADRVHVAPASKMAQICAAPVGYEWLEVLAPGGAPADALPAST